MPKRFAATSGANIPDLQTGEASEENSGSLASDKHDTDAADEIIQNALPSDQDRDTIKRQISRSASRSQMQISLTLDSTMDPEKLQKSLELLKRYGVI